MSIDLDHFRQRLLQEAFTAGCQSFWLRRAATFTDAARSRPGDYRGESTPDERAARHARLTGLAAACRARASLAPLQDAEIDDAVAAVLAAGEAS